jgi:hypothetical protein
METLLQHLEMVVYGFTVLYIYINNSVHSLVPYHDAWFLYSAVSVLIFDL